MTTAREYLTQVKARIEAATPAPWDADSSVIEHRGLLVAEVGPDTGEGYTSPAADADLIAHAPADLARMEAALTAVLDLHESRTWDQTRDFIGFIPAPIPADHVIVTRPDQCRHCRTDYPCPTVTAITTPEETP